MWFKMDIKNHSEVEFQPKYVRFSIRDINTGKRTAVQENEKIPVWQNPNDPIVGLESKTIVYAFQAFTMDKHKNLLIEISEKNGGRNLMLKIPSTLLLKSKPVQNS